MTNHGFEGQAAAQVDDGFTDYPFTHSSLYRAPGSTAFLLSANGKNTTILLSENQVFKWVEGISKMRSTYYKPNLGPRRPYDATRKVWHEVEAYNLGPSIDTSSADHRLSPSFVRVTRGQVERGWCVYIGVFQQSENGMSYKYPKSFIQIDIAEDDFENLPNWLAKRYRPTVEAYRRRAQPRLPYNFPCSQVTRPAIENVAEIKLTSPPPKKGGTKRQELDQERKSNERSAQRLFTIDEDKEEEEFLITVTDSATAVRQKRSREEESDQFQSVVGMSQTDMKEAVKAFRSCKPNDEKLTKLAKRFRKIETNPDQGETANSPEFPESPATPQAQEYEPSDGGPQGFRDVWGDYIFEKIKREAFKQRLEELTQNESASSSSSSSTQPPVQKHD